MSDPTIRVKACAHVLLCLTVLHSKNQNDKSCSEENKVNHLIIKGKFDQIILLARFCSKFSALASCAHISALFFFPYLSVCLSTHQKRHGENWIASILDSWILNFLYFIVHYSQQHCTIYKFEVPVFK